MILLVFGALALVVLAPLAWATLRPARVRERAEADRALYRAQRAELDRERAAGRLDEAAHAAALLEVQRRALAVPDAVTADAGTADPVKAGAGTATARGGRGVLGLALVFVPAFALAVYLLNGVPNLPSATLAERRATGSDEDPLLALLRERLGTVSPESEAFKEGWTLLANAERNRGRPMQAAEAYAQALRAGFDPEVAGQRAQALLEARQPEVAAAWLAEALPRAPDHVGLRFLSGLAEAEAGRPERARAQWTELLAVAPEGAPWGVMVRRRMEALP
jgi:cytochrome c-type biogenesis protein CcmH